MNNGGTPTSAGAEIDLVLELGGKHGICPFEIKRSSAPRFEKRNYHPLEDIQPSKTFVIYTGDDRYPLSKGAEAIGLPELMTILRDLE